MQIDGEEIEIFLMNMVFKMKTLKRQKLKKTPYHASSLGEWAKHILVWNCPMMMRIDNLWNLKLSYLNKF